jgi:hypothetical protein
MEFSDSQASSRLVMADGTVLTKCDQCRPYYAEKEPPETPPCESCRVDLRRENEDAARIFQMVRGQVVTAGNGQVIDINHMAVWAAIDAYGVRDRTGTFEKVCTLFHSGLKGKRDEG